MVAAARKSGGYHHGDLQQALLDEAERALEAEGIRALTLRSLSRAVGVTHAAPASHFGDLTGLLSVLAARGYRRFAAALAAALDQAGPTPHERSVAIGRAYVGFAAAHPGMFALMFRSERLDRQRPELMDAMIAAGRILRGIVVTRPSGEGMPMPAVAARMAALWSLAHGYAVLMLDGRLDPLLAGLPGRPSAASFFDEVLDVVALLHPGEKPP